MDADEWVELCRYTWLENALYEARRISWGYRHDPVRVRKRITVATFLRGQQIGGRGFRRNGLVRTVLPSKT